MLVDSCSRKWCLMFRRLAGATLTLLAAAVLPLSPASGARVGVTGHAATTSTDHSTITNVCINCWPI